MKNNKTLTILSTVVFFFVLTLSAKSEPNYPAGFKPKTTGAQPGRSNTGISFTENKGQIHDQNYKPRPDVLFGGESNGLVFRLRNNGISYQLNRIDSWKKREDPVVMKGHPKNFDTSLVPDQSTIYRLDINWLNANTQATIQKGKAYEGYNNYYLESCPNGALKVKSFEDITYQNIYNGIDLKWYQKNGQLKYDYIVAAGADYKQIQLQIEGAKSIKINPKGELEIKTPLGTIIEQAPLVKQNGRVLVSKWLLRNNTISFGIVNINSKLAFVIDPGVRVWGTYYGGNFSESARFNTIDLNGNVYFGGETSSNIGSSIATIGSHQVSFGGGSFDAFLVKFDNNGIRLWGTYYGGSGGDYGRSAITDVSGNIYLAGYTESNIGNVISDLNSHQSIHGGLTDAFLAKFSSAGIRQWGTYYGGGGSDLGECCRLDASGNIYLSGSSNSSLGTSIATAGIHQSVYGGANSDAFLVKFNSLGVRQWGTYFGGNGYDTGKSCAIDLNGDIFLVGETDSNNSPAITTFGSHQPNLAGGFPDAFIAKFNSNGTRLWGTYYGGNGLDFGYFCFTDGTNVYLTGDTDSNLGTAIATPGSHQPNHGGGRDAFLVKFDTFGARQWGTYYGGSGTDYGNCCVCSNSGKIYLAGLTDLNTSTIIATAASHQSTFGGGNFDAFLVQFNSSGVRQWGTYYGGSGHDGGSSCISDVNDNVYLAGFTGSNFGTTIATVGSHQPNFTGGTFDAFLAKFLDCTLPSPPTNSTSIINQNICANSTTTLTASNGTNIINWFATPSSTLVLVTGTTLVTASLTAGSYTFYAEAISCAPSASRTAITVTVNPNPTITVSNGVICKGNTFTIAPTGASTYTISGGNAIVSPSSNTSYSIAGTGVQGCLSSNTAICNITVNPLPTISVNNGTLCSGQSFTIAPSGANTYTISGGSFVVTPTLNTVYSITGTSSLGCISSNTAISSLTVNPSPTISANNGAICKGESFTIIASGANTYTISGGNSVVTPSSNTSYSVTGASTEGCVSSNTAISSITVNPLPTVIASSSNTTICSGETSTISANGAPTYIWNTNATLSAIAVSPTITTSYTVTGTDTNGCSSFAIITQSVDACTSIASSIVRSSGVEMFPNPTNGILNVLLNSTTASNGYGNESEYIQIINSLGQVLLNEKITAKKFTLNISDFSSGVYYVKLIEGNKIIAVQKIIKEQGFR